MTLYMTKLTLDDLEDGESRVIETPNGRLLVTIVAGKPICFAAKCPHASADLADGSLSNGRVSCPKHGWKFDVVTGRTIYPSDEACRLKTYPVSITNGYLSLDLFL